MATRLWSVVVDAGDPVAQARFWGRALAWEVLSEPHAAAASVAAAVSYFMRCPSLPGPTLAVR